MSADPWFNLSHPSQQREKEFRHAVRSLAASSRSKKVQSSKPKDRAPADETTTRPGGKDETSSRTTEVEDASSASSVDLSSSPATSRHSDAHDSYTGHEVRPEGAQTITWTKPYSVPGKARVVRPKSSSRRSTTFLRRPNLHDHSHAGNWKEESERSQDLTIAQGYTPSVSRSRLWKQANAPDPYFVAKSDALRRDPFASYPVKCDGFVGVSIDHWLHVWAPNQIPASQERNPLLEVLFPLALQNVELFEAIIALAESMYHIRCGVQLNIANEETKEIYMHQGAALKRLREKIQSTSAKVSESIIMTVLLVMGTELMFGERAVLKSHLRGLRQMVAAIGGFGNSPTHRFIKPYYIAALFNCSLLDYQSDEPPTHPNTLNYPTHPFSPALCKDISSLPQGFQELALQGTLSLQVIRLLQNVTPAKQLPRDGPAAIAVPWEALLAASTYLNALPSLGEVTAAGTTTDDPENLKILTNHSLLLTLILAFGPPHSSFPLYTRLVIDLLASVTATVKHFVTTSSHTSTTSHPLPSFSVYVAALAIAASNFRPQTRPIGESLLNQLIDTCPLARDGQKLEDIFGLFWEAVHLWKPWQVCWGEGMRRWKERKRVRESEDGT